MVAVVVTLLTGNSAAALWGLRRWPQIAEVTAPGYRRRPGIHTHRTRTLTLTHDDIRIELYVPTTSAARTISDVAPWLSKHGLPIPKLNTKVNGYEVDALYENEKVIVELDSWKYHKDHARFLSDRERDAHHLSYGYPTVRITEDRLTLSEAERLRQTLQRQT